jgi:glycosyltransferase involved in cell wall biosynthesis
MNPLYNLVRLVCLLFFMPLFLFLYCLASLSVRLLKSKTSPPRLVWGSAPIINNCYWSDAMKEAGFSSETFTGTFSSIINKRSDWDRILDEEYPFLPKFLKNYYAFLESLFKYDVFFISFRGFFLGNTALWRFQAFFLKLAGKKIVAIPYGGDAYVYRRINSTALQHALMMSYPLAAREQTKIARQVEYWCEHGDVVNPGLMGPDGFGRWEVLSPSSLCLNLDEWKPSQRNSFADGSSDKVIIAHAPNHRGFKGTEFVIDAVEKLKAEGLAIGLILIEGKQNTEVRDILRQDVDILVDQLIFPGHGLNAVEGLASGLPVISNLEDEAYLLPFRRWSYFSECPIASASPENVVEVLRKLVTRPELRRQLGKAGRAYAEKYHSPASAQYLFGEVIEYLYGRRESLINIYHPLLGEYPKRKELVEHPLVDNRIVD